MQYVLQWIIPYVTSSCGQLRNQISFGIVEVEVEIAA